MLDVTDRLVVIVGGGAVAVRKAKGVLEAGATRVHCVSPAFDPAMPSEVQRVAAAYDARLLDGASLVFAATDLAAVNDAVVRDARARGALVTRADVDEGQPGDFITPAKLRQGPVVVAVSTGGSPALAALIRDSLNDRWDHRWSLMAGVLITWRPLIRKAEPDVRRAALLDLATEHALDVMAERGIDGLLQWLRERHPGLPHG